MFSLISYILRFTKFTTQPRSSHYETLRSCSGQFETLSPKLIGAISQCIPKLTYDKHKGQSGRVCVIGGSVEYTGAPYFAGISALRCGADLCTIVTSADAATPIKSYSGELIVLPDFNAVDPAKAITSCLARYHTVVIGPGLGRDPVKLQIVEKVLREIKERKLPLVIDADGLHLITQRPEIIQGYQKAILTPNAIEFDRLFTKVCNKIPNEEEPIMDVKLLAKTLQVTVVLKGSVDIVSNGAYVLVVGTETSPRRCGGQGDLLAGFLSIFSYWTHLKRTQTYDNQQKHLKLYGPTMLAAVAACAMTRECNRRAFAKCRRAMLASDMIDEIGAVFEDMFGSQTDCQI
ncbi:CARKD [Bugula neritina]|uniref:ATP-dependent (S)-NAD(P)H-hydrate dehydratase n=1 Tax=Bugula neritina TaxID=10212 RepID=A0A7J7KPJ1_BUGNE|nr:CARKD [Bugula neritina]